MQCISRGRYLVRHTSEYAYAIREKVTFKRKLEIGKKSKNLKQMKGIKLELKNK